MLTVICGEDTTASRNYIHDLKKHYTTKRFETKHIVSNEIVEIHKNSEGVMGLFGQSMVYFIDNLSTAIGRKKKGEFADALYAIVASNDIQLIDWENGKSAYNLTSLKKMATHFKEFKPQKSIFQLLDACYPGNLRPFLQSIQVVTDTQESSFIYAMLCKHIRTLILAKENALGNMSPWQKKNVTTQAQHWNREKLIGFYEGLAKIDMNLKTSNSPFEVKKAIEILACLYL